MTDTWQSNVDHLPAWGPKADLNVADLANALEHIRRAAWAHFIGDAFDPAHMHAIAAIAAMALLGDPIQAPIDASSPEWRAMIVERYEQWIEAVDDGIMSAAGLLADAEPSEAAP